MSPAATLHIVCERQLTYCSPRRLPIVRQLTSTISHPFHVVEWSDYPGIAPSGQSVPFPWTCLKLTFLPLQRLSRLSRCTCTAKASRCTSRRSSSLNPTFRLLPPARTPSRPKTLTRTDPGENRTAIHLLPTTAKARDPALPFLLRLASRRRQLCIQPVLSPSPCSYVISLYRPATAAVASLISQSHRFFATLAIADLARFRKSATRPLAPAHSHATRPRKHRGLRDVEAFSARRPRDREEAATEQTIERPLSSPTMLQTSCFTKRGTRRKKSTARRKARSATASCPSVPRLTGS